MAFTRRGSAQAIRLPEDDDDDAAVQGSASAAAGSSAAANSPHDALDDDGLPVTPAPEPFHRRYAVWIASVTCVLVAAVMLAAGAVYMANKPAFPRATATILVSLDGVRPEYLGRGHTPTLASLAARGIRAEAMMPVFPSKTFPNHYTLVTGLHAESHGIVSNRFWSPEFNELFDYTNDEVSSQSRWWLGEPIWNTVMKAGKLSACYFWPGSAADIQGMRPNYTGGDYSDDVPNDVRVAQVVEWLRLEAPLRPSFISLYFSTVDSAGHSYGPDSEEVNEALAAVDRVLGYLVANLTEMGILDATNLVVVSDHGMTATSEERVVWLDKWIDVSQVDFIDVSPVAAIWPHAEADVAAIFDRLKEGEAETQLFRAFWKDGADADKPLERWHYRASDRIPPILVVANEGYEFNSTVQAPYFGGDHGYDNAGTDMQAILVAAGPDVRGGVQLSAFESVDVYNFLAAVLGVQPAANEGSMESSLRRDGIRW